MSVGSSRAVIIGSGLGGLAAAIRLAVRGYRVTVVEQLDAPGGRAYTFRQDGFVFDAGPTIITAPFLLEQLWELCGRRMADDVQLRPLHPFYRIRFHDGTSLDCSADDRQMEQQIAVFAAEDLPGYRRFLDLSRSICEVAFEQLAHQPFGSVQDMLRLVPRLYKLKSYRSIHSLVAGCVRHPKLRFALSFHPLFIGGNPFTTTSIYGLIAHLERRWGVHYAIGGVGSIVDGMVRLVTSRGGTMRYGERVALIATEGRRATGVVLASGERIDAEVVVSNADSATTYRNLLPAALRKRWSDARLSRASYSMSLFVWYFGTDRVYADVPHHTILSGPRYRGLLRDIFERRVLAEDFSLYLHRPTASDRSLAPPGCDSFYVLSPVPNLQSGVDWRSQAEPYRLAIGRFLASTLLPGLEAHIVSSRILTPLDFQDRLSSYRGAAFGLAPALTQSAWFRPHNRSEDIDGLFLVGAGTHPGAGVPGVLSSARILDRVVPDANPIAP